MVKIYKIKYKNTKTGKTENRWRVGTKARKFAPLHYSKRAAIKFRKRYGWFKEEIKMPNNKFSKGKTIHRTKRTALEVAKSCKKVGMPYRIIKLKKGYRVDKNWR